VIFLSVGCDSSHLLQKHLQQYQERMANVLDVEDPDKLTISLPPYPPLKDLKQNIPDTTIKLFEFYNLKHCELYSLVAERNTSLGNLQLPSIRYIYERRLISALQQCLIDTTDPKLREKLENWQQTKTEQLPMVWANLIQLSSELKQGLSANFALVEGNQQDGLIQTKETLNYLLNINQNKHINSAELERHLKSIMNNPLPAKLWLSQLTFAEHLNRSTSWLLQHTNNLQCSGGRSEKKIEYLSNVFQQFFIEKIQPIGSQINHYHYQLSPIFEQLTAQPHLSTSFKEYIKQFNQQGFENYQMAMQQHIQFWQDLFKRCNIKPGKR
tara:strand:+ start:2631 stop:3608 length:978 start_codon:yes stop_codon:yes gene_type:complete